MWLPLHTCATHPPAPRDGRRLRAQQAARAVAGTPQRSLRHCLVQRELLGKGATWCTMRAPKRGDRALEGPAEHCVGAAGHPRGPWAACALPACFSSTCCQPRPATTPPSPAAPLACPAERRPHADCQRRPDRLPVGHRARRPDWWAQGSRAESRRQPSLPLFGGPHVLSALQRLPSRSCSHSQIRPAPPGPPPPPTPHPPPPTPPPPATFRGHSGSVKAVCPAPGASAVFASGARDGALMVWDARAPAKIDALDGKPFVSPVITVHVRLPCFTGGLMCT